MRAPPDGRAARPCCQTRPKPKGKVVSPIGDITDPARVAQHISRLRRQRLIEKLHHLGPPALGCFLAELGREADCAAAIQRGLESYATIDPRIVRMFGGDRFPRILDRVGDDAA